ncbi:CPA2 family monovalent cation:H+ antiporter-2/glutathione-regulated potassium-efflux system protein KefB [Novosphingobium capsulatum]|uniref:CPA2 family monovalent cation:H+ antiporter-2/glutathione-regulated potassium-efflux system protein KefB n=1 Tax=Novosphingobium capsulatum TaxID=13688 RepID=A0ABU1MJ21_9SPHN|nr:MULTISPECIES: cation:proton antiporter [Novosphingobium]MDR6510331.1 CPA2 family monovalent cation:H+ antiporter-2/glutathione-regulated potassium-efflux system protein KefB [Novosphingobium capsulatum]PTR12365.1 Kef-type potassium/proton antiporter (CPA2 family) [Novosphingobium sp. GV055]PUB05766.1 Kef-type potassium/proton antiporter (CPA2 family) [Novosphingobium sp. GV061]PUB21999.1 Kef-type potassium/proton antiporter (CPA2 family) [Novosphingobium sp. GV079]PUB43772.1 Kef-type potass
MNQPPSMLHDGFLLLGFAMVFVLVFRRLGLGATLGYLLAGAVVGPQVLGLVGEAEQKLGIAELGITLLLFLVGLELNPSRLWRMKRDILGLGLLQVVLCGAAITAVINFGTDFSLTAAIALGLPLALSSTAQVLPMLQASGRLRTPFGERTFAILLFQDLSIIPMITLISALSRNPADANGPPGWQLGLYTVLAIAGLILAGRYLIRPLFRLIGNLGEREMFVVAALFTVMASAAVMEALGLSTALGAFIAGVMLADSPYRHELEADVEPFRSILLGLFFLAVGMMLDLHAIAERPLFVIAMALSLVAVKAVVIMGIGLAFRMPWRGALALGLLLSQGGEFGFVLFAQAQHAQLIAPEAASLFGAIVTLSMATTPFLMALTKPLRNDPRAVKGERQGPTGDAANALIVGYGRFGQTVAQMLNASGLTVTLIDTDVEMIDVASNFGAKVYFGDGTRLDLLRQAGADEAALILFCMDGDQMDAAALEAVQQAFPQAAIFVRAFDRRAVVRLRGSPAKWVIREVMESAVKMARLALAETGVSEEIITRAEDMYRARDKERLKIQIEGGDLRAARERIITEPQAQES